MPSLQNINHRLLTDIRDGAAMAEFNREFLELKPDEKEKIDKLIMKSEFNVVLEWFLNWNGIYAYTSPIIEIFDTWTTSHQE